MHRPAVDADDITRAADEPDELENAGVIQQVDAVVGHRKLAFGAAGEVIAVQGRVLDAA